jgi:hypothetical protein
MVRIDLADLIEREQIKTLERLSKAIEALQARLNFAGVSDGRTACPNRKNLTPKSSGPRFNTREPQGIC